MKPSKARSREYSRRYRERHPDRAKAAQKRFRETHREYNAKRLAAWHRENVDHVRERQLRKYGLTIAAWEQIFNDQGRRCAICGSADPKNGRGWCTDHDHKTGVVRGILCHHCNVALGMIGDDAASAREWVPRLMRYLGEEP